MSWTKSHSDLEVANYLFANTRDEGSCWIWCGPMGTAGYGQTRFRSPSRGPELAHRLAFSTWVRPPVKGEYVLHRCDVKPCINPDHLFVGTQADNIHDAIEKGRFVNPPLCRGEDQHLHKLRATDIPVIRRRLMTGEKDDEIATDYGVVPTTIWFIRWKKTWGWIPEQPVENPFPAARV